MGEDEPVTALACPRCGGSLDGARFYGPCPKCQEDLKARARLRSVIHRLLGFLTPGWGDPKVDEKAFDEMARREREARETRRMRRARR